MKYRLSNSVALKLGVKNCSVTDFKRNSFRLINFDAYQLLKQFQLPQPVNINSLLNEFIRQCIDQHILVEEYENDAMQIASDKQEHGINLTLEVTNSCNYSCKHCYVECGRPGNVINHLPLELLELRLREIQNDYGIHSIVITGGEPLLYPHIENLFLLLHKLDITNLTIITNCSLLKPSNIGILNKYAPVIQTSLLGFYDIHDQYVGIKNAFTKTVEAIKRLHEKGFRIIVNYLLSKDSINDFAQARDFFSALGVQLRVAEILPVGRAAINNDLFIIDDAQLINFYKNNGLTNGFENAINGEGIKLNLNNRELLPCGTRSIGIDAAGNVLPCIMMRKIRIGNIKNQSINDILKGEEASQFKQRILIENIDKCSSCELTPVCHKLCPLGSYAYLDRIGIKDPTCKYY